LDFVFYQCNAGKLSLLLNRNPFQDEEVDARIEDELTKDAEEVLT